MIYNDGKFFNIAVEQNSIEIVKALLDYFENNQLAKYPIGSLDYSFLKKKMHDILEIAVEDVEISDEMKKVLEPYIDLDSSDYEEEIKELDEQLNHYNLQDEYEHDRQSSTHDSLSGDDTQSLVE